MSVKQPATFSTVPPSLEDFDLETLSTKFGLPEYIVFVSMLLISAAIGIFYGCFGKKQTTSEFLMAGRSMGTFPVSMSLIASFMSAITLLGTPAEMYQFGTQFWVIVISYVFVMASAAYLYLPVFFSLQVTSAYEYLELRFGKSLRILGSASFTTHMVIYMSIVVYAPALALSQVTGMNVYVATTGIFVVCIFYTALGGMKAVMWTDTFQVIVMFGAMLLVTIKGMMDSGGNAAVWEIARNGSRVEFFNFNLDPRDRHTFWSLTIGGYWTWLAIYGVNQAQVQRYLSVAEEKMAQKAIWINWLGLTTLVSICCYAGLIIFARYHGCDPILSKKVQSPDQLFPLFVMDTLGEFPGLPGFFVAGIFSGALSTVSSGLNSLAAISLEDFVKIRHQNLSDEAEAKLSKYLSIGFGIISYGLVFIAAQMGTGILQAGFSIIGIMSGPLLGVFTLGIFFPWANSKGALTGMLSSLAVLIWLGVGANISIANKTIVIPKREFSIQDCPFNVTLSESMMSPVVGQTGGLLEFYRLSYMWYSMLGSMIVIFVGLLTSFVTGAQDPRTLRKELISPPINRLIKNIFGPAFRQRIGWQLGIHLPTTNNTKEVNVKEETMF